ncbi:MAG: hypothetical protein ACE14W_00100 [Candidatus Velamenicoccus archaeovorus]
MSDRLPPEVLTAFDGTDLADKIGPAYLLLSSDPDGTPRPCMLSAGELLAVDERHLRIGLWPGTHTSENLSRSGPVVLCFVAPGTVLYIRGTARPLEPAPEARLARFEVEVTSVESDVHPGMPVTETITFDVERDRAAVAADWDVQIRALRA